MAGTLKIDFTKLGKALELSQLTGFRSADLRALNVAFNFPGIVVVSEFFYFVFWNHDRDFLKLIVEEGGELVNVQLQVIARVRRIRFVILCNEFNICRAEEDRERCE